MKKVAQDQILERYTQVVRERRKYSNCQFMTSEIEEKVQFGILFAYDLQDAFLMIEYRRELYYLYYTSNSWDWLSGLDMLKEQYPQLIVSIVQRQTAETGFGEKGYPVYKTYQRLRSRGNSVELSEADYCNEQDKYDLRKMMDDTFDILSDHIPTDEELELFVTNKQIICVRSDGKVAGFIIFEDKGKTSYIRMVCVDKDYQGKGLADDLMKMYFGIHQNYTGFTLWYDIQNDKAGSLYKKWNYEEEGLYNIIFVI